MICRTQSRFEYRFALVRSGGRLRKLTGRNTPMQGIQGIHKIILFTKRIDCTSRWRWILSGPTTAMITRWKTSQPTLLDSFEILAGAGVSYTLQLNSVTLIDYASHSNRLMS